jgi:hypothetical protein
MEFLGIGPEEGKVFATGIWFPSFVIWISVWAASSVRLVSREGATLLETSALKTSALERSPGLGLTPRLEWTVW